jgi:hypothetical protein
MMGIGAHYRRLQYAENQELDDLKGLTGTYTVNDLARRINCVVELLSTKKEHPQISIGSEARWVADNNDLVLPLFVRKLALFGVSWRRGRRSQCEGRGFDPLRLHQAFDAAYLAGPACAADAPPRGAFHIDFQTACRHCCQCLLPRKALIFGAAAPTRTGDLLITKRRRRSRDRPVH